MRKGKGGYEVWQFQYRDFEGRGRTHTMAPCSEMPEPMAIIERDRFLAPFNAGLLIGEKASQTLNEYVREVYLPTKVQCRWKGSTTGTTEQLVRKHLLGVLGARPLRSIMRRDLQGLLVQKAKVLAEETVKRLRGQIRGVFKMALADCLIDHDPSGLIDTPRDCQAGLEKRQMTLDQARHALTMLPLRENLIFRLGTFSGMRPGEILALRLGDVDLGGGKLTIRRRVYRGKLDTPKSKRGRREIPLVLGTATVLEEWIGRLADRRAEAWLFPSENPASPLGRDNLWRRHLQPTLNRIGLGWAHFQVMRRSCATLLAAAGIPALVRAAILGHSVDVEENEYVQVSLAQKQKALESLEPARAQ